MPKDIPVWLWFYHKPISKLVWGKIYMSWRKYRKVQNIFCYNEKKVKKIKKYGNESVVTVTYKIRFIDSARFMATWLSNLVDNLTEKIHTIKYGDCDCFLGYEKVNNSLIKCKCLSCN